MRNACYKWLLTLGSRVQYYQQYTYVFNTKPIELKKKEKKNRKKAKEESVAAVMCVRARRTMIRPRLP